MLICLYAIGDIMSINISKNLTGNAEEFCNALSVPERIIIIKALGENEVCACRLIEKTSMDPMVVLNHIRVLRHARIVGERKEGEWTYYAVLNREAIEAVASGSCVAAENVHENIHIEVPTQNIDAMIGKYKSSYVYEAEALFRRGC